MIRNSKFKTQNSKLRAKVFFMFFLLVVSCQLSVNCFAQNIVSSTELIEHAKDFDSREVVYQGEVIGEVMPRGDYCWVNLKDADNAVGIWVKKDLISAIKYFGSYKSKGDWIEVQGVFYRACAQHGADLDIHALSFNKIEDGRPVECPVSQDKKITVIALAGVMLCLLILQILKRRRVQK